MNTISVPFADVIPPHLAADTEAVIAKLMTGKPLDPETYRESGTSLIAFGMKSSKNMAFWTLAHRQFANSGTVNEIRPRFMRRVQVGTN